MRSEGDHICVLYETEDEGLRIAAEYLAEGLERGERCVYVSASLSGLDQLHGMLRRRGIDPDDSVRRKALIHIVHADTYLAGGRFDSERLLSQLDVSVELAKKEGFTGLRACGDMSWLVEEPPGSAQLLEYEALIDQLLRRAQVTGMCQYNLSRLKASFIDHALVTHPVVMIEGRVKANGFYKSFQEALTRTPEPDRVEEKISQLRRV